mmetsp:Transcript_120677/g.240299  ORF Transcript_120677/g.240299 Transcript_120677/m.240299 type:complete len:142 (+) Transcript_120677:67-492(+)
MAAIASTFMWVCASACFFPAADAIATVQDSSWNMHRNLRTVASVVAAPPLQTGGLCGASFNDETPQERCNAVVQFVKSRHSSIPDKYWPDKETCKEIEERLAELKDIQAKCDKSITCWKFLKGVLPVYVSRYEHILKEKKC